MSAIGFGTYGHREVLVRGYVDAVVISCGVEVIARHRRSYEREDLIFDPLHYLSLLERKIGALDQAAPLAGWQTPPFPQPRARRMASRSSSSKKGFSRMATAPALRARAFIDGPQLPVIMMTGACAPSDARRSTRSKPPTSGI